MNQKIISTLLTLVNISLNGCIIYYLNNLSTIGCECAINYKRHYIFAFTIFSLFFSSANLLLSNKIRNYLEKTPVLLVLLTALTILNIVFTLLYIDEVKKANCDCSESVFRDMMFVLSIIQACAYGITFLSSLYITFLFASLSKEMSNITLKK
jgi:hypothetical protein